MTEASQSTHLARKSLKSQAVGGVLAREAELPQAPLVILVTTVKVALAFMPGHSPRPASRESFTQLGLGIASRSMPEVPLYTVVILEPPWRSQRSGGLRLSGGLNFVHRAMMSTNRCMSVR